MYYIAPHRLLSFGGDDIGDGYFSKAWEDWRKDNLFCFFWTMCLGLVGELGLEKLGGKFILLDRLVYVVILWKI